VGSWAALAEKYAPYSDDEQTSIREAWPEQLQLAGGNPFMYEGMPDRLAQRIALLGVPDALAGVDAIESALSAALNRMDPVPTGEDARYAVTVLSMVNALRCGGLRQDRVTEDDAREQRWLAAVDPAAQSGVRRGRDHAAIAAAGAGFPEVAIAAAAEGPEHYDPTAIFGCDLSPFAAHLAAAQQAGTGRDGVEPAWQSFLRTFPGSEAAHTVQWLDLLWAARAVYAVLGNTPVGEVGVRLHEEVGR